MIASPFTKLFWPAFAVKIFVSGLFAIGLTTKQYSLPVSTATGPLNVTLVATDPSVEVLILAAFNVASPKGTTSTLGNPFWTSLISTKHPRSGFLSAKNKSKEVIYPKLLPLNISSCSTNDCANGSIYWAHMYCCSVRFLLLLSLFPLVTPAFFKSVIIASGHPGAHLTCLSLFLVSLLSPGPNLGPSTKPSSPKLSPLSSMNNVSSSSNCIVAHPPSLTSSTIGSTLVFAPVLASSGSGSGTAIVITLLVDVLVVSSYTCDVIVSDNTGSLVFCTTSPFSIEKL